MGVHAGGCGDSCHRCVDLRFCSTSSQQFLRQWPPGAPIAGVEWTVSPGKPEKHRCRSSGGKRAYVRSWWNWGFSSIEWWQKRVQGNNYFKCTQKTPASQPKESLSSKQPGGGVNSLSSTFRNLRRDLARRVFKMLICVYSIFSIDKQSCSSYIH